MKKRHILLFSQTGTEVLKIIEYLNNYNSQYSPYLVLTDNSPYAITPDLENYTKYTTKKYVKNVEFLKEVFGNPDDCIITLHGWLNIVPDEICNIYEMYNGHPGLITRYPELKGKDPQKKVWERGNYDTVGCVIHEVTPEVDGGKLISIIESVNDSTTFEDLIYKLRLLSIDNWCKFLEKKLFKDA